MKRNIKKQFIVSFLVIALVITAAFALLTARDSRINEFTIGDVEVELWEGFDKNMDGAISGLTETSGTKTYSAANSADEVFGPADPDQSIGSVNPGNTIKKEPWIENTGESPAYVYMLVGMPRKDLIFDSEDGPKDLVTFNSLNENWKKSDLLYYNDEEAPDYSHIYYLYYLEAPLEAGEQSPELFKSVTVNLKIKAEDNISRITVPINAFAIQTTGVGENASEAWNAYVNEENFADDYTLAVE